MSLLERCAPEERLPNELIIRVLLDDRRVVLGEQLFGPLDVAAIYADFDHKFVKKQETRDLIRRLLAIHERRMRNHEPIREGKDDDELDGIN